mgnify:CR=1 FL=1
MQNVVAASEAKLFARMLREQSDITGVTSRNLTQTAAEAKTRFNRASTPQTADTEKKNGGLFGGMGLDYSYAMVMAEELGHITCGSVPMAIGVGEEAPKPAAGRAQS